jgi:hypothetical protein
MPAHMRDAWNLASMLPAALNPLLKGAARAAAAWTVQAGAFTAVLDAAGMLLLYRESEVVLAAEVSPVVLTLVVQMVEGEQQTKPVRKSSLFDLKGLQDRMLSLHTKA